MILHLPAPLRRLAPARRAGALLLLLSACRTAPAVAPRPSAGEADASARLEAVRGDSALLAAFLRGMPKGGDLHNHLSGAIYAESYLRWAAAAGACVDTTSMQIQRTSCPDPSDRRSARAILADSALRRRAVAAWSMQDWRPGAESGHDHFFATFGKFSAATADNAGAMLAEASARAAAEQVSYMELMYTADPGSVSRLGQALGWTGSVARLRQRLDSAGLRDTLSKAIRALDADEARRAQLLRCGTAHPEPACDMVVRYLYQVSRGRPPEQVFAQILAGFELATMDGRFVGFNLVAPEDGPVAMRDFPLHMAMIDSLHALYPRVAISLHAGELTPALVPREGLRSHIRQSVELGHARRIGHGVDVMLEDDAEGLLREMAARRVLVEIALTSNDVILDVRGAAHPLAAYLAHGVPVALATDDAGVSRSDMTQEFVRAVRDQKLDYRTLKTMARNSIEYSFVDDATKARLLSDLDERFRRFEGGR